MLQFLTFMCIITIIGLFVYLFTLCLKFFECPGNESGYNGGQPIFSFIANSIRTDLQILIIFFIEYFLAFQIKFKPNIKYDK